MSVACRELFIIYLLYALYTRWIIHCDNKESQDLLGWGQKVKISAGARVQRSSVLTIAFVVEVFSTEYNSAVFGAS